MAAHYILEPGNPDDFSQDELEELRIEIEREFEGARVEVTLRPERGYGVTLEEVLVVWDVATDLVGDVTTVAGPIGFIIGWMRRRSRRERDEHPDSRPRPRTIQIYGPDGKALKRVVIEDPEAEPRIEAGGGQRRELPDT
jgi:hypothetical protein